MIGRGYHKSQKVVVGSSKTHFQKAFGWWFPQKIIHQLHRLTSADSLGSLAQSDMSYAMSWHDRSHCHLCSFGFSLVALLVTSEFKVRKRMICHWHIVRVTFKCRDMKMHFHTLSQAENWPFSNNHHAWARETMAISNFLCARTTTLWWNSNLSSLQAFKHITGWRFLRHSHILRVLQLSILFDLGHPNTYLQPGSNKTNKDLLNMKMFELNGYYYHLKQNGCFLLSDN